MNAKEQAIFFNRNKKKVYNIINRYVKNTEDVENLTSDTFLKLFDNVSYSMLDCERVLKTVATNFALSFLRKQKPTVSITEEHSTEDIDELVLNEDYQILHTLLKKLPNLNQKVIQLRYFENKCYRDISIELQISEPYVKKILNTSKKKLNQMYKNNK